MSSIEQMAAKVTIDKSGLIQSKSLFPIDVDKIVTSTSMKVGEYTIAAQPTVPCLISFTVTANGTADTMGTITIVGKDISENDLTETITPVADDTVYTDEEFSSITSVTGEGWVIDGVEATADSITVGVAGAIAGEGMYFTVLKVVSSAVVSSQTNLTSSTIADLSNFTSLPVGEYPIKSTYISLTSGEAIGIISRV